MEERRTNLMTNVMMPQLGETVADGTVTKWLKNLGEMVTKGEPLFEVSTDKVDTEIPAPANGILSKILVSEGETVDVGTVLAVIGGDGDGPVETVVEAAPSVAAVSSSRVPARAAKHADSSSDGLQLSPVVRRLLEEHELDAGDVVGTGPNGRITKQDVLEYVANAEKLPAQSGKAQSPIVRRLIRENNIDPATVTGSGPSGTIVRTDVESKIQANTQSVVTSGDDDEVVPFTKIRRLTAQHMAMSKATSAHTLMVREVDYERVEMVRRQHGAKFKEDEGFSLTYLPFNALAAIEALRDFPHLNASVGSDELIVHRRINLGIAVDLENDGLVVPVLADAQTLGVRELARAIRDVATRARTKKLGVDELSHGTFTITNPGPYGTLLTGAIINQPQVAILSTDAVTRTPVVVTTHDGLESIAIHSVGMLALTFDHRAVDGAYVARFLRRMAEILSTRDWQQDLLS
jgi:2-oxoglutarate dehydrogenase E2 component (dihydrolipoamide succinyltransferase)